jgi:hypothetical protein
MGTRSGGLPRLAAMWLVAFRLVAACGGDGTFGGPYSCDFPGSQHVCLEYSCAAADDNPNKCAAAGGTLRPSCNTTSAVGGCTIFLTRSGGCTRTEWDYYGSASTIMQACAAGDGTYRAP